MAGPEIKPATYQDLLALPDDVVGEIVDGELVARPRPRPQHGNIGFSGALSLGNYHGPGGGGEYVVKGTWGDDDVMVAEPFPLAEIPLAYWWGD